MTNAANTTPLSHRKNTPTTLCERCRCATCECKGQALAGEWCFRHDLPRIVGEMTCWRCEGESDYCDDAYERQNDYGRNDRG